MSFLYFNELAGSPVRDVTPIGQRARREAIVPQNQLENLISYVFPLGDFGRAYPGNSALRASSMHVEPWGGDGSKIGSGAPANLDAASHDFDSLNTYEFVRVAIEFETVQADADQGDDPQLLLNHRWAIGAEVIVPSAGGFEWSDGGIVSRDVRPGIFAPTIEHQITWMRVERPPFAVIRDRIGTVNNDTLLFKTGEIAPETLMFMGAELNRDILTNGALAWQVGYHFTEKRVVGLTIDDSILTQVACEAQDGVWNSDISKCSLKSVGGHNHFYRSEDNEKDARLEGLTGWYRLRTKAIYDDSLTESGQAACIAGGGTWDSSLNRCVVGGRDPVVRLTSFNELFQQAP